MSRAIVLGSGTSSGVPSLGREYPVGFLANPKNFRTRPSLLLQGPGGNVLVDCAPEMRLQLIREGVRSLEGVVLTHTHADHVMGMDDLRTFCREGRAMDVWARPEHGEQVRRIFDYAFLDCAPGIWVPRFELHDAPPVLDLAGLEFQFFEILHGTQPILGLRVANFAYLTDLSRIPTESRRFLEGLDHLIVSAVRYRPHPNHLHYAAAIETALEIGARETYFTHLSDDYDHDEVEADLPSSIHLAYDGLRIRL